MASETTDVDRLLLHVQAALGDEASWAPWPGGWPGQVEMALLDSVFSIQAAYGGETSGVRRVVKAYRDREGADGANDLRTLAAFDPARLSALVGNRSQASGRPKVVVAVEAAKRLVKAGVTTRATVDPLAHRPAWTAVHGLGDQTWNYFCVLLGFEDVKADTWVVRFVGQALGRPSSPSEAHALLHTVAERLGVSPTNLDHAVWRHTRAAGRRRSRRSAAP